MPALLSVHDRDQLVGSIENSMRAKLHCGVLQRGQSEHAS
jgi:hypothetical protein